MKSSTDQSVLIVDDDARNIFALKAVLKAKGFSCLSASAAKEGITILQGNPNIFVVLMDMMMPEMDGYEAIREIRRNANLKQLPVIAVTAQAMVGDREQCLAAGANDYISKPVDIDLLLNLLTKYAK